MTEDNDRLAHRLQLAQELAAASLAALEVDDRFNPGRGV
jgi:hypothetical protein